MERNTIYLLRHADTDRTDKVHFSEYPLSDLGKKQANDIIPVLKKLKLDLVYSSPFKRALETIGPFIKNENVELRINNRLMGRIVAEIANQEIQNFFIKSWNDYNFSIMGAESAYDCQNRMFRFIQELNDNYKRKKILLVTHSNPISLFLNKIDSAINYNWFKEMKSPSLFKLSCDLKNYTEINL